MQPDGDRRWAPTAASMFGDLGMTDDERPDAAPEERIIIDLVIDRDSEAETRRCSTGRSSARAWPGGPCR